MKILLPILLAALQDRPPLAPEPSKEVQAEKLKLVKDVFKDDYAKRAPADQQALAVKLLQQAAQTQDDPGARYVMLREARDLAQAAGDTDTALGAVDELSKSFAVDATALRMAVLAKSGSTAKTPDALRAVARGYLAIAQSAIRADDFDGATSAAAKAESAAKGGQDLPLALRAQEAKREATAIKDEYQKVKGQLDNTAPSDPEAVGRYLCLVKGDWEKGLPLLAAGAKGPLKALAEKDAANPAETEKQVELADGWWELAGKEKSPWRRQRMLRRAQTWLEQALPQTSGLTQVRLVKRQSEIEEATTGAVDVLHLIDVKKDAGIGEWSFDGPTLASPVVEWARVQIPYVPPEEYDLTVVFVRPGPGDCLTVGLGRPGSSFAAVIDAHPPGGMAAFDILDGTVLEKHPATVKGLFIKTGQVHTAVYAVRKGGVTVTLDGKTILSFQGAYSRLSQGPTWRASDPKIPLFVGAYGSVYRFLKITLLPVTGQGRKVRP